MAQSTATGEAGRLLRGQRCETPAQMKAFTHDAVGLHLLGQYPYKEEEDLITALEAADNNKKEWGRQRLQYQISKIMSQMAAEQREPQPTQGRGQTRPAEYSPSDNDLTEGFAVGNDAVPLDMTLFEEPPTGAAEREPVVDAEREPAVNVRGGRPVGTTIQASRDLKKAHASMVDSATK
jgi:hypothetical protein